MIRKLLTVVLTLLVFWQVRCQSPPTLTESYIAWGEVVQPFPDPVASVILQMTFEESYDSESGNAAFFLYLSGKNLTFVKNSKANQTFLYLENENGTKMSCSETNEKEWIGSDFGAGLLSYEEDDGTVRFSLSQLTNIPEKFLKEKATRGVTTEYRGMSAKSWMHEIKTKDSSDGSDITLTITSYWSDGNWNTSAGKKVIPLGFNVSKSLKSQPRQDYIVSVFGFVPNAYDHKYFEPYQGIYCEGRKSTVKFPNVQNIRAISMHFETTLPSSQEIRYTDMWFDPQSQLVRVDIQRRSQTQSHQSDVAIGEMGIVYRWTYYKGEGECEVISFDKYINDIQNLIDVKQDLKKWQMGKIFGLNDTSYVYIGKTLKFGVPCHIFQGIRTDWPDKSSKRKSLWEWCFNVNMTNENDAVLFSEGEFGLINANVVILEDPAPGLVDYRLNHHFYEVKSHDPKMLDATRFDISKCFKYANKRMLQFFLDDAVTPGNMDIAENATSDLNFLQKWKTAIYKHSELPDFSLRVSNVRATIDGGRLYVKFTLLDMPEELKTTQISSYDAEVKLRRAVNDGKVSIKYNWGEDKDTLLVAEHSVSFQIDPRFEPQTMEPPVPTEPLKSTTRLFTLRPDPDDESSTTQPSKVTTAVDVSSKVTTSTTTAGSTLSGGTTRYDGGSSTTPRSETEIEVKYTGHQSGTVAGVSIALLLIGISIGSASTFYKFNGLPQCLRR